MSDAPFDFLGGSEYTHDNAQVQAAVAQLACLTRDVNKLTRDASDWSQDITDKVDRDDS